MAAILDYKVTQLSGQLSRAGTDSIAQTHVISTDSLVTLGWIQSHRLTPKLHSPVQGFPGYYWDDLKPVQKAKLVWEITGSATPFEFEPEPDSPLAMPADIAVNSELIEEPTQFDWKGRPIVTRAGEWIAGVMRSRPLLTYVITKNLGTDPNWSETHLGAVNLDPVRIRGIVRPPNTLMLRRLSLSPYQTKDRVRHTVCSFELHYDPRTWIKRLWNVGTIQLVEFTTDAGKKAWKQERILTEGTVRQPVENAVPLDLKGRVIPGVLTPDADTPVDVSKMVRLDFHVQPLQAFNGVLPLL
jgi:hypothetical protein